MHTNGPIQDTFVDANDDMTGRTSPVPGQYQASVNMLMDRTDEYYEIGSEENEEERTALIGPTDSLSESDNEP
ncbi:hypothetical protein HPULCUR_004511 [Helicostylum pulchrum]|uniref:Uncharacterized protein n=1 Tax=Helicostylum pulchrum TaxID=562976 RepID=A0ABP9XYH2_9FUNG